MKKYILSGLLAAISISSFAQDDLVKSVSGNKSDSAKKKFQFTNIINLGCTDVKNQGSSGTCWSYSTNSFLESEMIRQGKKKIDLAEIFTARKAYSDKADIYVRLHGGLSWGDGGECHDVIQMYAKYGALPQEVYSGLQYGTDKNKFGEMQAILKGLLDAVVQNKNGRLTTSWKKAFEAVMDAYLGPIPEKFTYEGKEYTPKTFAEQRVGLNPDDYLELSSWKSEPLYKQSIFLVPDNWSFQKVYNIKMNDITRTIDYALENGFTVAWATDVSEKYFSWKNGVAYVPEKEYSDMEDEEKEKCLMVLCPNE